MKPSDAVVARSSRVVAVCAGAILSLGAVAHGALVVPYTETFSADAARWSDRSAFRSLAFVASGAKDGSSYASGNFSFTSNSAGDQVSVLRGQGNFNSSTSNFVGNWITGGVSTFSFDVRQHSGGDLVMFARFAASPNFPGAAYTIPFAIPSDTWTTVTVPLDAQNPAFTYETTRFPDPTNQTDPALRALAFGDAFSAISRVQVGVFVSPSLAGTSTPTFFDIDNVGIVPTPGIATLGLLALARAARRARR